MANLKTDEETKEFVEKLLKRWMKKGREKIMAKKDEKLA